MLRSTGAVLWLLLIPAIWISQHSRALREQEEAAARAAAEEAAKPGVPLTLDKLPPFELTAHTGEKVTRASLLGQPWVAAFVFTRCQTTCSEISLKLNKLQAALSDDVKAKLISITVDPTYDTPEVLAGYAENFNVDPDRWLLITGTREDVYRLATVNLGMFAREMFGKDRKPGYEVAHTNRVVLVNAEGIPVRSFLAVGPTAETELLALQRILEGKRPFPDVTPPPAPVDDEPATDSKPDVVLPSWLTALPKVNAGLNTLAAVLLIFGFGLIKSDRRGAHKACMLTAFCVSIAFLACYLTYHQALKQYTGAASKSFGGTGIIRTVYYSILFPHIILAATVPVLAAMTIYRGLTKNWDAHRKLARITFPIWLYVSVTGLIIYLMLYHGPLPPTA